MIVILIQFTLTESSFVQFSRAFVELTFPVTIHVLFCVRFVERIIGRKADELRIEVAVASQENTLWPSDISRRVRASKVRHMQARDEFGPVMVWW